MKTYHHGNKSLVELNDQAYYFSVQGSSYGETDVVVDTASEIAIPDSLSISGGYNIVQEGDDNKLPYQLRQLIDDNNLMEGVLVRQAGLQYGQGLAMYQTVFEEGRRVVKWDLPGEMEAALKEWDYQNYLYNTLADILFKREYYTKFVGSKGMRIGLSGNLTGGLQHMPVADCRREYPDDKGVYKNVFIADWREGEPQYIERYPLYDPYGGPSQRTSVHYERIYQPGRGLKDASLPKFYGSRKWMQRSNVAPQILKAQSDNGMNIKWHIVSPQAYWDKKEELLREQYKTLEKPYYPSYLEDLKDAILTGLAKVLSGVDNTGKFFHSESVMSLLGVSHAELQKWELIPLDMKVKDFTDAQIKISKQADSAITSATGLAPSLANIVVDGKLASGSEKLYDYKLFIATETPLLQMAALKAINIWKRVKFPNMPFEFGFYHDIVKREEDITPSERTNSNNN